MTTVWAAWAAWADSNFPTHQLCKKPLEDCYPSGVFYLFFIFEYLMIHLQTYSPSLSFTDHDDPLTAIPVGVLTFGL